MIANKAAFTAALDQLHIMPLGQAVSVVGLVTVDERERELTNVIVYQRKVVVSQRHAHSGLAGGAVCRDHAGAVAGKGSGSVSDRQLARRSGRCTADKMPPCNNACGTNEKIQGYLDLVKRGKYLDAYALIKEDMPFPSVTGRVCYHPCEQACNRGQCDEAISIRAVERFLGDLGQALPTRRGDGRRAQRQEGRGRRIGPGGTQRRVPAGAPRLRGHDPREVAEGRRAQSRRHSRTGCCRRTSSTARSSASSSSASRSRPTPRSARTSRWDELKKNYDACVLAVGLTEPNSVRAEGEDKDGVPTGCRSSATSAWARRR